MIFRVGDKLPDPSLPRIKKKGRAIVDPAFSFNHTEEVFLFQRSYPENP
jgi:hypothetical protein